MAQVGSMLSGRQVGQGHVVGNQLYGQASTIKQDMANGQISRGEGHDLLAEDRGIAAQARLDTKGGQSFGGGEAKQLEQEIGGIANITNQA